MVRCTGNRETGDGGRMASSGLSSVLALAIPAARRATEGQPGASAVVEPFDARLLTETKGLRLEQGKTAELALKLENIPDDVSVELRDLPRGARAKSLGRKENQETFVLEAAADAEPGTFAISAETSVGSRRASASIALTVHAPSASSASEP